MKQFILLFAIILTGLCVSGQSIRIHVQHKDKQGNLVPLADTKFEVTLNDSIKTELTSASDGTLGKLPLDPGTYHVVLSNPAFARAEEKNVVVTDKKMTTLTIICLPASSVVPSKNKKSGK